jgi:transcriptional regulator with XRE-family HTH domain
MRALGASIREIRRERGLTITALHYETRIQHRSIANLERGVIHPRMDVILAVCRALDVKPSTLFTLAESRL